MTSPPAASTETSFKRDLSYVSRSVSTGQHNAHLLRLSNDIKFGLNM